MMYSKQNQINFLNIMETTLDDIKKGSYGNVNNILNNLNDKSDVVFAEGISDLLHLFKKDLVQLKLLITEAIPKFNDKFWIEEDEQQYKKIYWACNVPTILQILLEHRESLNLTPEIWNTNTDYMTISIARNHESLKVFLKYIKYLNLDDNIWIKPNQGGYMPFNLICLSPPSLKIFLEQENTPKLPASALVFKKNSISPLDNIKKYGLDKYMDEYPQGLFWFYKNGVDDIDLRNKCCVVLNKAYFIHTMLSNNWDIPQPLIAEIISYFMEDIFSGTAPNLYEITAMSVAENFFYERQLGHNIFTSMWHALYKKYVSYKINHDLASFVTAYGKMSEEQCKKAYLLQISKFLLALHTESYSEIHAEICASITEKAQNVIPYVKSFDASIDSIRFFVSPTLENAWKALVSNIYVVSFFKKFYLPSYIIAVPDISYKAYNKDFMGLGISTLYLGLMFYMQQEYTCKKYPTTTAVFMSTIAVLAILDAVKNSYKLYQELKDEDLHTIKDKWVSVFETALELYNKVSDICGQGVNFIYSGLYEDSNEKENTSEDFSQYCCINASSLLGVCTEEETIMC